MSDLIERAAKAIDLLPCPFCGGTPELMDTLPSGSYWYRCEECCGETEGGKTHAEAIAAWNRRASPQPANPAQVTDAMVEAAVVAYNTTSPGGLANREQMHAALTAAIGAGSPLPEPQIEHMVQQFLRWKLPDDFNPDGGIQFVKQTDYGHTFEPVGTNLFDYKQAKALVLHMLEGLSAIGAGGQAVASVVPEGCTGSALAFDPGVLHVNKDGSGYIAVNEDEWQLEDDRCEGPDGPEGSVHWITRLDASEMQALRDFLNGAPRPHPAPSGQAVAPVGWFNQPNDFHGYQQVAKEFEGSPGAIPLFTHPVPSGQAVADLTYGKKLIAEAIVNHFGERDERYEEYEGDTTVQDVWEAFDALSAIAHPVQPGWRDECATEGCGKPASVHFVRGGIGSYYCHDCYLKVQALPAAPQPKGE